MAVKATQKAVNLAIIDTALVRIEAISVLNSFKRKNRGTKVSLASHIKELENDLLKLKKNIDVSKNSNRT